MPWNTPTLSQVRGQVRDAIRGQLPGADANVPNSVLRVLSDNQGALCHLVLQYVDWLALQLMPDSAETEWLDRHAYIWLVNTFSGSTGRKLATPAYGEAAFVGPIGGALLPTATRLTYDGIEFATTADVVVNDTPTAVPITALDPGSAGNLLPGTVMTVLDQVAGVSLGATVINLDHGTDQETDDELRARVLERIRNPPMGGSAEDFVRWTLSYPGVTRAWCAPLELGMGTVTVRFMMDDLRADNGGFPDGTDVDDVATFLNGLRPVAVKDFFVQAPIPFPINFTIKNLDVDDAATRNAIEQSLQDMFMQRVSPGQEIYYSWIDEAISEAPGENHHDLIFANTPMPAPGYMGVLGTVVFAV